MGDRLERLAQQRLLDEAHTAFAREWPALEPAILDLYRRARELAGRDAAADAALAARVAMTALVMAAYKRGYLVGAAARDTAAIGPN